MTLWLLTLTAANSLLSPPVVDVEREPHPLNDVRLDAHATGGRDRAVHLDADADGTHWVRGRRYKASASSDGLAFIPFLGSDAPRNYPVHFRLVDARRDGWRAELAGAALVTRTERRIVLDRGGVEVRYDVSPDGIEQSFALPAPLGSGDLELTLAVETELSVTPEGGGFRFSNELGGVSYGAALALDSAGRSMDVSAEWSDGTLSLTVPASFLGQATGPIVVDPLITAFALNQAPADLEDPDGAYSVNWGFYCVVAEERFSASDTDLYSWFVTTQGLASSGAYIDQTSASWENPTLSISGGGVKFDIVAEADSVAFPGKRDLVGRRRFATGALTTPYIARSATATYSCIAPDIGADDVGQGGAYRAVYLRDYGAYRGLYTFYGYFAFDSVLSSSSAFDVAAPAISQQTGLGTELVVAWARRELATGATSVEARLVDYLDGPVGTPITVAPATTGALYFDVQTSLIQPGGDYLVTWDDRPSDVSDAFVALGSGSTILDVVELQVAEHADRAPDHDNVCVATTENGFWLGCVEESVLYLTSVRAVGGKIGIVDRREVVVGSDVATGSLTALQELGFGSADDESMFVWEQAGASNDEIHGVVAPIISAGPLAGTPYCYGAENSTGDRGFIQTFGTRAPGASHTLRVSALPPGVFGFYLASMATASVPGAGGSDGTLCVGGTVGRFGLFQVDTSGASSYDVDTSQIPQPMGAVEALAGQSWSFQSWFRDSSGGAATSNFTNGSTVVFQ